MCIAIRKAISWVSANTERVKTHTLFSSVQEKRKGLNIKNELETCSYHSARCFVMARLIVETEPFLLGEGIQSEKEKV